MIGNDAGLVDQIKAASAATDEPVWELPLARRYRKYLDSDVADMNNLGGAPRRRHHRRALPGGAGRRPPVGPHRHRGHRPGRRPGRLAGGRAAPGFGARLLVELADSFTAPAR